MDDSLRLTLSDLSFLRRVEAVLEGALPGGAAQRRMAPRLVDGTLPVRAPGSRQAAALLLLFAKDDRPHLVLTLRAHHLPYHAGQVSLPGGRIEPDESPEMAALREAEEELGIPPALVRIAGRLTPLHIPVSGFTLQAVVGVATGAPSFVPAADEVAEVLEVPIAALGDPVNVRRTRWTREGRDYDIPFFDVFGHQVWGATAMILAEFLTLCGCELPDAE